MGPELTRLVHHSRAVASQLSFVIMVPLRNGPHSTGLPTHHSPPASSVTSCFKTRIHLYRTAHAVVKDRLTTMATKLVTTSFRQAPNWNCTIMPLEDLIATFQRKENPLNSYCRLAHLELEWSIQSRHGWFRFGLTGLPASTVVKFQNKV